MIELKERSTSVTDKPVALNSNFTSTGAKFFFHEEAMRKLANRQGQPIVSHVMLTDICNHTCAFCSVLTRDGHSLSLKDVDSYLEILQKRGLLAVILSGGGNPILFVDKETKRGFNAAATLIHERGLELGLITNGMPLKDYPDGRRSWKTVAPDTLSMFKWIRISMSGLDHAEDEVFVPDIDPARTTLGFSYIYHDRYDCPSEKNHGKVSTAIDFARYAKPGDATCPIYGRDRLPRLTEQIAGYVQKHHPRYVRLLPNCLEPSRIPERCAELQEVANQIDPQIVFVQNKPPRAPGACYLFYVHPVLNSDGYVYPCDSVVLNEAAGHKFSNPWRVCHWSEVDRIYDEPVRSVVDPQKLCPGCVFSGSNDILASVVDGTADITPPAIEPIHSSFV